jgi:peptidoglycan/xylan/chitin deacetylase (PgdA/CDA1 family)
LTAVHTITFDNLGEVAALQRGDFPAGEPLGRHFSVTRALPRILALLEETGLRATFFVEGLNTELYPETLSAIAAARHEVGYHGWCHEEWAGLQPGEEAELLSRGVRALDALGLRPLGFRPPGGELTPASPRLLRELGFTHCSPAGDAVGVREGLAILPFAWPLVDAFHYLPRFAGLRGSDAAWSPAEFARTLGGALQDAVAKGRHSSVVFHAFLAEPEDRFAVVQGHLRAVRGLVDRGALVCAPYREVAARLRAGARAS